MKRPVLLLIAALMLARFINAEIERWGKVIQQAGLAGTE